MASETCRSAGLALGRSERFAERVCRNAESAAYIVDTWGIRVPPDALCEVGSSSSVNPARKDWRCGVASGPLTVIAPGSWSGAGSAQRAQCSSGFTWRFRSNISRLRDWPQRVASGSPAVAAGAQEPQCTYCVHEDSEHRRTPLEIRAVAL